MTSIAAGTAPRVEYTRRSAIIELARLEASSMLRRTSIWLGLALSLLLIVSGAFADEEWSAQKYQSMIPLGVFPMTIAVFVAGVRAGNRDRWAHGVPLAGEAALDGDQRTVARLASLIVPVGIAATLTAGIAIVSRIEGGFWVGDGQSRTENAVHSIFELLQPALVVAVVGAGAVGVGRWVVRAGPAIVIGAFLLFATGSVYWMWNAPYAYAIALMQVQPLGELDVIHTPTAFLHDVYLIGLVVLFAGLALRGTTRRRLAAAGGGLAVLAAAAQLAVTPL